MKIEIVFQLLAVALAGVTIYFLFTGNRDGGFISAVLACVAFFLNVRFQAKARNKIREAEREAALASEPSDPQ